MLFCTSSIFSLESGVSRIAQSVHTQPISGSQKYMLIVIQKIAGVDGSVGCGIVCL